MYLSFSNPNMLLFLFFIPILIFSHFYFLKRSKTKAMKFANYETLKRIKGERLLTSNLTHLTLRCIIVLLLVISLSGASFNYLTQVSEYDFVLAIDSSPSMTTADLEPSRFEAAKDFSTEFVNALPIDTGVGLVSFGGVTYIEQPITNSKTEVRSSLINMGIAPAGGTDFSNAVITSTNLLQSSNNSKAILLISDGLGTVSPIVRDSIAEVTRYALDNNVVVHSITLGTRSGPVGFLPEYYGLTAAYETEHMRRIAEDTGGLFFHASDVNSLSGVIEEFDFENFEGYATINLAFFSLIVSLLFLFVDWVLVNTAYRRIL